MNAERYRQIDRLFDAVLDRPDGDRDAYLARACGDDDALRAAVRDLLDAEVESRELDSTGAGRAVHDARLDALGSLAQPSFGPYRAVERVGQGGMGDVYLAERDGDFERRVAVKVIRHGLTESEALRERFHRERQILARLEHPHIAALYDGGTTDDGRPWLAMEWVDGEPLDRFCDRHRLGLSARIALFLQLCGAVEHAHRHLLVHRDLKPANILVARAAGSGEGVVKLLDFGIAKPLAHDAEGWLTTRTGLRPMSPAWASPEQVRGDEVTTASDVYGLGVLLYELLSGTSPYRLASELPHELEAAILSQEPRRPSTVATRAAERGTTPRMLRRQLAGDLDAIVLRAIEKDPARRYGSVAELAADLQRHRADEPVLARRAAHRVDAFVYRTGKLWRRHRLAITGTWTIVALLAASLLIVSRQAGDLAEQRDRAERTFSALTGVFDEGLRQHGGAEIGVAELLTTAAEGSRRELADEPAVRARLLGVLAGLSHQLGRLGQAEVLSREALDVVRQAELGSMHEIEPLYRLGVAQHGRGEMRDAAATFSRALARIGDRPSAFEAPIYTEMAQIRWKLGDRMARDHLAHRALALLDDPAARPTDDPVQLAILRGDLSALVWERDAAVVAFDEAYRLSRRRFGDAHPTTAWSRCKLGAMQRFTGSEASARQHLAHAMAFLRASGDDRLRSEECDELTLGRALLDWRDWRGAEAAYWRHYERMVEREGPDSYPAKFAQLILASTILHQGDLVTAEALLNDGLDGVRELAGDDSAAAAPFYCTFGELMLFGGRPERADEYFTACADRFPSGDAFGRLWADFGHGRVALRRGEPARAVEWLARSFDAMTARVTNPSTSADLAEIGIHYAEALAAVGRIDEAIEVYAATRVVYADPDAYCDGASIVAEIDDRLVALAG